MINDITCSLSGVEADEDDLVLDDPSEALDNMPIGWFRVTMERRILNPDWVRVQQGKGVMVDILMRNVPETERADAGPVFKLQVEAQFAALEERTPKYIATREVVYVAPPETDQSLADAFYSIREQFGLDVPTATAEKEEE